VSRLINIEIVAGDAAQSTTTIVAIVVSIAVAGILMAVVISLLIWRRLHVRAALAAQAFLRPNPRTVMVSRPPRRQLGRPTVPRADLVRRTRHPPQCWDWTPCGSSPASTGSWNARQWYNPDADCRLVPPGLSEPLCGVLVSTSNGSRAQNWYRPSYNVAAAIPNFYYSARVTDPHVRRTIPSFYSSRPVTTVEVDRR